MEKTQRGLFWVVFFGTMLLIFLSFSKVEYYEYGFFQRLSTSTVDRSKVYAPGNYFIGPDATFMKFPSTAQLLTLNDLSVWSRSSSTDAGTAMVVDAKLQFTLNPNQLRQLYESFNQNYYQAFRNLAIRVIKNNGTLFSADEWVRSRKIIQNTLLQELNHKFESIYGSCLHLQIRRVDFPTSFVQRKLFAAIQLQKNAEEAYKQESTITRSQTELLTMEIENQARVVRLSAEAEASLLRARAENSATDIEQNARSEGLAYVRQTLDLKDQAEIVAFDYQLRLIESNASTYVDFPFTATQPVGG